MAGLTLILMILCLMPEGHFVVMHYDFQQCIMLHIALGNNVATGYNSYIDRIQGLYGIMRPRGPHNPIVTVGRGL